MKVLSLFDGMSCGQLALQRAGIKVDRYFASEIDKYAIQVTQKNFPDTIQLGDVTEVSSVDLPEIDLLIGGSPCQGFSFAGKQLNFDDPRSKLFFEFVRLLKELRPSYFLLENVKMKKEYQDVITEHLGVEPIEINSNLVSAQNRRRLYWTNIPGVGQPEDKGKILKDIIENGYTDRLKSLAITTRIAGATLKRYIEKSHHQIIFMGNVNPSGKGQNGGVYHIEGLSPTLTTNKGEGIKIAVDHKHWRKLTPIECERLQTVPDNYSSGVSNSQRYRMLGNGWTVDVISHIFKNII